MYEPNPQRIPRLRQILTGEKKKKKKKKRAIKKNHLGEVLLCRNCGKGSNCPAGLIPGWKLSHALGAAKKKKKKKKKNQKPKTTHHFGSMNKWP